MIDTNGNFSLGKLQQKLIDSGLNIISSCKKPGTDWVPNNSTLHDTIHGVIGIIWKSAPTEQDKTLATTIINNFDPTFKTSDEKTTQWAENLDNKVFAALIEYAGSVLKKEEPESWAIDILQQERDNGRIARDT